MNQIRNAIIEAARIDDGERGLLTAWIQLDYGGEHQQFGGYSLYLPESFSHHQLLSTAGHFIYRCMQIAGVTAWADMKGKTVRVDASMSRVDGIGHIVNDDWFYPSRDFKDLK